MFARVSFVDLYSMALWSILGIVWPILGTAADISEPEVDPSPWCAFSHRIQINPSNLKAVMIPFRIGKGLAAVR